MRGGVGEDRQLIVLGGDVHDRVRHQVDQCEGAGHAGGGHIADSYRDPIGARLSEQLSGHVRRQLNAVRGDPPGAQRTRHPPGKNRELWRGSAADQFGEQIDQGQEGRRQRGGCL